MPKRHYKTKNHDQDASDGYILDMMFESLFFLDIINAHFLNNIDGWECIYDINSRP
jgi:hypothetical protein